MQRCPRRRRQLELTLEPRSTQSRDVFFLRGLPYFALNENVFLFSGFSVTDRRRQPLPGL